MSVKALSPREDRHQAKDWVALVPRPRRDVIPRHGFSLRGHDLFDLPYSYASIDPGSLWPN